MASILFSLGSTFSHMSVKFTMGLDMDCDMPISSINIFVLASDSMVVA